MSLILIIRRYIEPFKAWWSWSQMTFSWVISQFYQSIEKNLLVPVFPDLHIRIYVELSCMPHIWWQCVTRSGRRRVTMCRDWSPSKSRWRSLFRNQCRDVSEGEPDDTEDSDDDGDMQASCHPDHPVWRCEWAVLCQAAQCRGDIAWCDRLCACGGQAQVWQGNYIMYAKHILIWHIIHKA